MVELIIVRCGMKKGQFGHSKRWAGGGVGPTTLLEESTYVRFVPLAMNAPLFKRCVITPPPPVNASL
jgi:hypothetical protein